MRLGGRRKGGREGNASPLHQVSNQHCGQASTFRSSNVPETDLPASNASPNDGVPHNQVANRKKKSLEPRLEATPHHTCRQDVDPL